MKIVFGQFIRAWHGRGRLSAVEFLVPYSNRSSCRCLLFTEILPVMIHDPCYGRLEVCFTLPF